MATSGCASAILSSCHVKNEIRIKRSPTQSGGESQELQVRTFSSLRIAVFCKISETCVKKEKEHDNKHSKWRAPLRTDPNSLTKHEGKSCLGESLSRSGHRRTFCFLLQVRIDRRGGTRFFGMGRGIRGRRGNDWLFDTQCLTVFADKNFHLPIRIPPHNGN